MRLNRSIERKYKRINNERTTVTEPNPHLVTIVESSNMLVWPLHAPICNFSFIRITNVSVQQQFQFFLNT